MNDVSQRIMSRVKTKSIPLNVQRSEAVGDSTAAVLFQTSRAASFEEFASAVDGAYEGKLRVLPGSAFRPNPEAPDLVQAFVAINADMRVADEEGMKGLTAVTANVFRDENDDIWRTIGEGEHAMLVRKVDDDLTAILEQRQCGSLVTASAGLELHEEAKVGQAIGWYDFAREEMRYGIKLAKDLSLDLSSAQVANVLDKSVVLLGDVRADMAVAAVSANRALIASTPLTQENMISKYMALVSQLYARDGAYMKKLKSLLETSFGAAALR